MTSYKEKIPAEFAPGLEVNRDPAAGDSNKIALNQEYQDAAAPEATESTGLTDGQKEVYDTRYDHMSPRYTGSVPATAGGRITGKAACGMNRKWLLVFCAIIAITALAIILGVVLGTQRQASKTATNTTPSNPSPSKPVTSSPAVPNSAGSPNDVWTNGTSLPQYAALNLTGVAVYANQNPNWTSIYYQVANGSVIEELHDASHFLEGNYTALGQAIVVDSIFPGSPLFGPTIPVPDLDSRWDYAYTVCTRYADPSALELQCTHASV